MQWNFVQKPAGTVLSRHATCMAYGVARTVHTGREGSRQVVSDGASCPTELPSQPLGNRLKTLQLSQADLHCLFTALGPLPWLDQKAKHNPNLNTCLGKEYMYLGRHLDHWIYSSQSLVWQRVGQGDVPVCHLLKFLRVLCNVDVCTLGRCVWHSFPWTGGHVHQATSEAWLSHVFKNVVFICLKWMQHHVSILSQLAAGLTLATWWCICWRNSLQQ